MAYSYLIPNILAVPPHYDVTVATTVGRIAPILRGGEGDITQTTQVVHEGQVVWRDSVEIAVRDGRLVGEEPPPIEWRGRAWENSGYMEIEFRAKDRKPIFTQQIMSANYSILHAPGRKSIFTDSPAKFGVPTVIHQIAAFGTYADAFSVIRLDRARDLGETLIMINPYRRPIVATVKTADGRALPRIRIPALSARDVALAPLMREGEQEWVGQIQISATNRVICFIAKHSLTDPSVVTDQEHLDPYRGEPTHLPLSQLARFWIGHALVRRGWRNE